MPRHCQRCALTLPEFVSTSLCLWCRRDDKAEPKAYVAKDWHDNAWTLAELSSMVLTGRLGITKLKKAWECR